MPTNNPNPSIRPPVPSSASPKRLRVLISAYACEPYKGSEPGVGWNVATEMAKLHDIWVLTRANNREVIEAELDKHPVPGLNFIYYDLPKWLCLWKKGGRGVQLYYYLWQRLCWQTVRDAYEQHQFDLTHHVTFGKYWVPSVLPKLPIPFVWGTVGGGESMPCYFFKDFSIKEWGFEILRSLARGLGERNPGVIRTARRSAVALASTNETAGRLKRLGCHDVRVVPQCALTDEQFTQLAQLSHPVSGKLRFISIGRPLHWKGFHLGLKAFAAADIPGAEYWIVATGKGRQRMELFVRDLGIADQVMFYGALPSLDDVYAVLAQCDVLVHPALHEAFGNVVLEAMAAARPVLTLDIGGPALQAVEGAGFRARSHNPETAVQDLAKSMRLFFENPGLVESMGQSGRRFVKEKMTWKSRLQEYEHAYQSAVNKGEL